ncbi:cytochrome P450 [Aquisediminimonas sediminicola]|uniref:cytochrome P450 n=1 Tax=Alteraquisediminimonas sediminicola TaxID=2676787 RepID=UPI001C8D286F|nr:cytochrome P450 [Aquisediminimonas sediminicola]
MIDNDIAVGAGRIDRPANVPDDRVIDFNLYQLSGNGQNFDEPWARLYEAGRDHLGLLWTPHNEGHWIAANGKLVADVLSNAEYFSNRVTFVPKSTGEAHHMLPTNVDVPEHRNYRRLLNNGLSPRAVRNLHGTIREICGELIETFIADGRCDFMTQYAAHLPIRAFMGLVQLPIADAPMLKACSDAIVRASDGTSYAATRKQLEDYLRPFIEARLGKDGDDMLSDIINGKIDGRALTWDEMFKFCIQILIGGLDTVINQLGFMFLFLARNPEHRRQLVENPSLIPGAVEEIVRRYSIANTSREVRTDCEYAGVQLKRGDMVLAATPVVGFDEAFTDHARSVDFSRRSDFQVGFGKGNHICPGANLARAELSITLEEWLKRIPDFSLANDDDLVFGGGVVITVASLPLVWNT